MKIFSLEYQILAGVISSAHGKSKARYTNAMQGNEAIFEELPTHFWKADYVEKAVQARYPKFWRKWIDRKSGQLSKMGEQVKRPFQRCGTESG